MPIRKRTNKTNRGSQVLVAHEPVIVKTKILILESAAMVVYGVRV